MQAYSDPKRESDPTALPDVEVFSLWNQEAYCENCDEEILYQGEHKNILHCSGCARRIGPPDTRTTLPTVGCYWRSCFPGCLPDGDPVGPFTTEAEALADAQQESDNEEEE